ncbi:Uncharacterised protein [Mycobacteroides abscessus subsp. abscessus]|nr:Uncharacterised protein [Mycobacteroides abscessus subsp. abscessus]
MTTPVDASTSGVEGDTVGYELKNRRLTCCHAAHANTSAGAGAGALGSCATSGLNPSTLNSVAMNFVGAFTTRTPPDVVTGAGPEPTTTCVADASAAVPANGFTTDRDATREVGISTTAALSGVALRGVAVSLRGVAVCGLSPDDAAADVEGAPDVTVRIDGADGAPVGWSTCEGVDVSAGGSVSVGVAGGAMGCDVVDPASDDPGLVEPGLVEPGLVEPGLGEPASEDGVSAGAACECASGGVAVDGVAVGSDEPVGPSVDTEESAGAACATEEIVACPPHHNTAPIPAPATAARTLRVEPLHLAWVIVLSRSSGGLGHRHSSVMGKPRVGRAESTRGRRAPAPQTIPTTAITGKPHHLGTQLPYRRRLFRRIPTRHRKPAVFYGSFVEVRLRRSVAMHLAVLATNALDVFVDGVRREPHDPSDVSPRSACGVQFQHFSQSRGKVDELRV